MSGEQHDQYVTELEASHAELIDVVKILLFAPDRLSADDTHRVTEAVRVAQKVKQ